MATLNFFLTILQTADTIGRNCLQILPAPDLIFIIQYFLSSLYINIVSHVVDNGIFAKVSGYLNLVTNLQNLQHFIM